MEVLDFDRVSAGEVSMNVGSAVEFRSRWQPDMLAVSSGEDDLTWAQLEERTARVGAALQRRGIEPGDRVGILARNSLEWCVLTIATLRSGGVVVPMNVRSTAAELAYIVEKAGLRALAYDTAGQTKVCDIEARQPGILTVSLDGGAPAKVAMADLTQRREILADPQTDRFAPALLPFTSGTTGHPKGVTLTHDNIRAMAEAYSRLEDLGSKSVSLCFAPLAFNGGVTNAFLGTFLAGGRLILEDFEPALALRRIVEDGVTVVTGVPLIFASIADLPEFAHADLSSLSTALTGGAVVDEALLKRWADKGVMLRQSYGLTEATGPLTMVPRHAFRDKATTAGLPGVWDRIRLETSDGHEPETGEVGEICVMGPQVMAGYWDDPEATREALRDGWLHTGDIGRFDSDGYLTVVDRKKDMIISGGINVYPAEIERAVAQMPGVHECVAYGVAHPRWGETVAVLLRGDVDLDDIYQRAKSELADYKVPRYLTRTDQPLPRSAFGKLLRRKAAELFDTSVAYRTPSS